MHTRRHFIGCAAAAVAALGSRPARASTSLMISVLTCPRPHGAGYLSGTLASVDAEVTPDVPRLLVCDGPEVVADGWTSAVLPPRNRARGAFNENITPGWVALRTAWAMGADLLFLEDDVRAVHRGAFAEMLRHEVPEGAAWTSFFSFGRAVGVHPAVTFRQSQAVKIPHRSLCALADAETRYRFLVGGAVWVDRAIGVVGGFHGWTFEQTHHLVEHIGLYSAANPTGKDS